MASKKGNVKVSLANKHLRQKHLFLLYVPQVHGGTLALAPLIDEILTKVKVAFNNRASAKVSPNT